jgi:hypothetical protein
VQVHGRAVEQPDTAQGAQLRARKLRRIVRSPDQANPFLVDDVLLDRPSTCSLLM